MRNACRTAKYRRRRARELEHHKANKEMGMCPLCGGYFRDKDLADNVRIVTVNKTRSVRVHKTCPKDQKEHLDSPGINVHN